MEMKIKTVIFDPSWNGYYKQQQEESNAGEVVGRKEVTQSLGKTV